MKSKFNTAKFRNQTYGASLVTAIVVCFGGTALAVDNLWTGATSTDWNTASNWSLGRVPSNPNGAPIGDNYDDAVVNSTPANIATITANVPNPRDFRVGQGGSANNGTLNFISGNASTGGGNWAFVGRDGATGVFNLANTGATGGTLTGMGQGSGSFTCNGSRLYVGGQNGGGGGHGTFNMNTTGSLTIGNDLAVGSSTGAVGVMNVDAGSISTGGWNFIGKDEGGSGANGTLNMAGGTLTNNGGRTYIGQSGSTGTLNLSGGSYINNNDLFIVGENSGTATITITNSASVLQTGNEFQIGQGTNTHAHIIFSAGTINSNSWVSIARGGGNSIVDMSGGTWNKTGGGNFLVGDNSNGVLNFSGGSISVSSEFWVGQGGSSNGTFNLSGSASLTVGNWNAIGRDGGTATVNMTGGTWTKTNGGGNFIIGASGPGTMTQSAGLVDVQGGDTWMAENNLCNYTLSGSGEFRATYFQLARNGGSTGNVNLNGGTLRVNEIVGGGGTKNIHFNGTQIIAKIDEANFITGMGGTGATIDAGGLKVDSAGHTLAVTQILTGTGGVIKSGAGKLTLSSYNSYAGNNTVNAGELVLKAGSTGTGNISIADGSALGVAAQYSGEQLVSTDVTLGTSAAGTTLNLNEGNVSGTNPSVPILNVSGNFAVNGNVALHVTGSQFQAAIMPLVGYNAATRSGSGNFVLGGLPNGVVATLIDNPNYYGAGQGLVYLNITSVSLPVWNATVDANWDATTANWIDQVTTLESVYANPAPVLFDDAVIGATAGAVVLNGTVAPSDVTFNNSLVPYSLSGTGKITGSTGLTKTGSSTLAISTANDYTGVTTLTGGILSVSSLTNAGTPSALGAASASPANLVFNGGQLSYTGSGETTDRGFTIAGLNSAFDVQGALTMSGAINATSGQFRKIGAGTLTLSNPGANVLGYNANPGFTVDNGTLVLSGGGTQTNTVAVDIWVGTTSATGANLLFDHTTLNSSGNYLAIARGNGTSGLTSTCTLTNSTLTTGNLSLGYSNGVNGYLATSVLTLNTSTYNIAGANKIGESAGATGFETLTGASIMSAGDTNVGQGGGTTGTLDVKGTSAYTSNYRLLVGQDGGSVGHLVIENSASVAVHSYCSIGMNGSGNMLVKDSGSFTGTDDFSVNENGDAPVTVTLQDNGTITAAGSIYVGRNGDRFGTVIQTGGTFTNNGGLFQVGMSGTGTWLQSGGVTNAAGWLAIGRNNGSTGVVTVSGTGVFNQTGTGNALIVGEEGTGTLNIEGTATVSSVGSNGVLVSNSSTGKGTVHLDGGTFVAKKIADGGGTSEFSFNGGVLKAGPGANLAFMGGLDTVNVNVGGAFIDSNGQTIAIGQVLSDGGGNLTKQGLGTLELNGANSYLGTTTVAAGTLGGTGSVGGELVVPAGSTIAPGAAGVGTFSADDTLGNGSSIGGTYVCEVSGAAADALLLGGDLAISPGAVLDFSLLAPPTAMSYVIATYATHTGTFIEQNVPAGFRVAYNPTNITLEYIPTAYSNWAVSHGLNPLTNGAPGADPDGDGQSNAIEFALGGDPTSASNNAKTFSLTADSSADGDSLPELLLTIAVRSGTPAFTGSPSPTSTQEGFTYTIEGSTTLGSFTTAVTPVTTVAPPAPNATPPAGYEYRTFSLNGSNGLSNAGFLRVKVSN